EEEQLVLDDGPADRITELVACVLLFGIAQCQILDVFGSEFRQTIELVHTAVKIVRAGLCNYVDYTARSASILCGEVITGETELLYGIERYCLPNLRGE